MSTADLLKADLMRLNTLKLRERDRYVASLDQQALGNVYAIERTIARLKAKS